MSAWDERHASGAKGLWQEVKKEQPYWLQVDRAAAQHVVLALQYGNPET